MLINKLPIIMIRCILFTIIIELIVALILGIREKKDILNVVLVNIMTNPIVVSLPVYINLKYGLMARNIVLYIMEFAVFIIEGLVYKKYFKYKKINPYAFSFLLNMSSYLIGKVINNIIY